MCDLRELTRVRMVLSCQRTRLKNRISSTLAKYGLALEGCGDCYGRGGRAQRNRLVTQVPPHTQWVGGLLLAQRDFVDQQIRQQE